MMASGSAAQAPLVDMERLTDLSEGKRRQMRQLVALYIRTMSDQMTKLQAALAAGRSDDVKRLAHSGAGASAMVGMNAAIAPLRELEALAAEGDLSRARGTLGQLRKAYGQIKTFLKARRLSSQRSRYGKRRKSRS